MEFILKENSIDFVDISRFYKEGISRSDIYSEIATFVTSSEGPFPISYLTYGDPMFFDDISGKIIELSAQKNIDCEIIPGIDFVNVILSKAKIPITRSLLVLNATDILRGEEKIERGEVVILSQVGAIGTDLAAGLKPPRAEDVARLRDLLLEHYPPESECLICDIDPESGLPCILRIPLSRLVEAREGFGYSTSIVLNG